MKKIASCALLVVGLLMAEISFAGQLTPPVSMNETGEWQVVQHENGIKTSFSRVRIDGVMYLNIRMENTTNESITTRWTLLKNAKVVINETVTKLDAGKTVELYDATNAVEINNGESYKHFTVELTTY